MRNILMGMALMGLSTVAWADASHTTSPVKPEPFFGTAKAEAVLNNPVGALGTVERAATLVQPGVETLFDVRHGQWHLGTSAALWTFSSHSFPIASLRAGYAPDALVYSEAQLDVPGITERFVLPLVPGSVQSFLTVGAMDGVWAILRKYGTVGGWVGYGFDHTKEGTNKDGGVEVGVSVGGKFSF